MASEEERGVIAEDKMAGATYTESAGSGSDSPAQRRSCGGKVKHHFRRFWICHLISFIFFTLLISLLLVYVAYPSIAQHEVNRSTLEIDSMELTNPTGESFHLHQNQVLHSYSQYHPHLDGFNASLFLEDTEPNIIPFAYVQVPPVQALSSAPVTIDEDIQITNLAQYTLFTKMVLTNEEYRLAIRGRPVLHEERYPARAVNYNQVITMKGLNGLKGFNVTQFQVLTTPAPDGANMVGTVYIPNPSVLTIAMGNVTMNLYVQGDFIGTSTISDLTLVPGNNTVSMRSTTNQTLVLEKLSSFPTGIVPIDIIGNSSIYNGQHLTYYEAALASNEQHIMLNVGAALSSALKA